jgi:hypothetical protein
MREKDYLRMSADLARIFTEGCPSLSLDCITKNPTLPMVGTYFTVLPRVVRSGIIVWSPQEVIIPGEYAHGEYRIWSVKFTQDKPY